MWSRAGPGCRTTLSPSAKSPASSTALFTCALAMGMEKSIAWRVPPRRVSGARSRPSASRLRICAPIVRRGPAMRPIGRRRRAGFRVGTEVKGCPGQDAGEQAHGRAAAAAVQTSSGSRSPCKPTPRTRTRVGASCAISTPSACMTERVARQSSAGSQPSASVSPVARAPKSTTRWEIDLSPGTRATPRSGRAAGRTSRVRWVKRSVHSLWKDQLQTGAGARFDL